MATRVKNIASADDLKRALLQKVPKLDPAQYMHLCTETVAGSYLAFILHVLEEVTPRLTSTVLEKAAMEAYKVPKGEAAWRSFTMLKRMQRWWPADWPVMGRGVQNLQIAWEKANFPASSRPATGLMIKE